MTGPWTLADLKSGKVGMPKNGKKVFSTFSCGGGSTMGYKLAGFDVIGCVEIDQKMFELYQKHFDPKYPFNIPIQEFNDLPKKDLPAELFDLDILDGSPPCSSFSMAGNREKDWGKKKMFKEGQARQVLDDLFFHFISTAKRLQPKMVVAENVKGLINGNARGYVKDILAGFDRAGYDTQIFLLNAALMGVPQARQRVFFIGRRKDLGLKPVNLDFNEPMISVKKAIEGAGGQRKPLTEAFAKWWRRTPPGKAFSYAHPKKSFFNSHKLHPDRPSNTVTATAASMLSHWAEPFHISPAEIVRLQTFPDDYDFMDVGAQYTCGMSVPPFMIQRIASRLLISLSASPRVSRRPRPSQSSSPTP